jgi:hypothetical protein
MLVMSGGSCSWQVYVSVHSAVAATVAACTLICVQQGRYCKPLSLGCAWFWGHQLLTTGVLCFLTLTLHMVHNGWGYLSSFTCSSLQNIVPFLEVCCGLLVQSCCMQLLISYSSATPMCCRSTSEVQTQVTIITKAALSTACRR